jgi:hypothetical protein
MTETRRNVAERATKSQAPFVEQAGPIAVPLLLGEWEENAIRVAADVGKHTGSRLIFIRVIDEDAKDQMLETLEKTVEKYASIRGVPYEYLDLRLRSKEQVRQTLTVSMREAIRGTAADNILLQVNREVFEGRRKALRRIKWVEDFTDKKLALVGTWKSDTISMTRGPRILIPALTEIHGEPFEIAEALTEEFAFPDVDVVAAKVVELPSIVPLYSVYRPESLVNVEQELSIFRSLPRWAIIRRIRPMVLLVRETGRDLAHFAKERNVDVIVMEGSWVYSRHGFLPKKERAIATKAECTVVVAVAPVTKPKASRVP